MTAQATLKQLAAKVRLTFKYGETALDWDKQDDWQQKANGYRCTLTYKGRRYTFDFWQGVGIRHDPTAEGCLECLLSDANVEEDFHDFCSEFGYDEDSRKAEATHKACLKVGREMRRLLGDDFDTFLLADR